MNANEFAKLLLETEKAHAASGHSAADWAQWYAAYILEHHTVDAIPANVEGVRDWSGNV